MKTIFKKISAAVIALAVTLTSVVFDVPERIMALAAAATAAETAEETHGNHSDWESFTADTTFENEKKYYLNGDVALNSQITIASGVNVTLCLNGHTITAKTTEESKFRIFYINGGSLTLCDCQGGGKLTGGNVIDGNTSINGSNSGGAIKIYGSNSTFIMNGGTISDCKAWAGSAVYVDSGSKFTMNGGTISGNTASCTGGGVFLGYNSEFTMNGGTISNNTASSDSGGGIGTNYESCKITMNGGTISNNQAGKNGGGVDNVGTFNMTGGMISGNTATQSGGGVYNKVTFTMTGGTISGNKATQSGGGVYNKGTFTMSGGTISGNEASSTTYYSGGGVYVGTSATFEMTGGTIGGTSEADKNTAGIGGGVYVDGSNAKFTMSGDSKILGNESKSGSGGAGGVCVHASAKFTMNGGTISGNKATNSGGGGVLVGSSCEFKMTDGEISGNTADSSGGGVFVHISATFEMTGGTISDNEAKDTSTGGGGVFVYKRDSSTFTMTDGKIENNKAVNGGGVFVDGENTSNGKGIFTMSGGTISGNTATKSGGGVYTNGTFTMTGGTIGGTTNDKNTAKTGGGVYVNGGTFTMSGDSKILGNTADSLSSGDYGGGVYVNSGTFTMDGGKISGNTADAGGGVFMNNTSNPTFTMNGGTISDNKTTSGGGVFVYNGKFEMSGGTISGNTASSTGGGVDLVDGTFTIKGAVDISGNTKTDKSANNVYLTTDKTITIGSGFDPDSTIGVITKSNPTCKDLVAVTDGTTDIISSFTADKDGQSIVYEDGKVQLKGAHTWDEWEITTEPTTETTGTAERTCETSDEHTETIELPVLTDTEVWQKATTEPTCTEDGSDVYKSEYGTVTVKLDAKGHKTAKVEAKEPTNTEAGNIEYWHCSVCEKDFDDEIGTNELDNVTISPLGNVCGDNLTWTYDEETKTLTITGTGDMDDYTDENKAPWSEIAEDIEKVVIDNGITSIGDNAFEGCTGLTDVTIPDSVTDIGDNAFKGCTSLEEVEFKGTTPPTMGNGVFDGADNLDKITVPEGSEDAYKDTEGFDGVTDNITDGTPDNTGSCGDNLTWTYDEDNNTLTITGTGAMDDWTAENPAPWADLADEIEKVVIGDGVTSIGDNAFEGCDKLTDVTIPDSVTSIGDNAFSGTGLTEVTIPESVTEIGDGAFADCGDLDKVTFEGTTPPALGDGAIGNDVSIVVPEGSEDDYKDADGFGDLTDNITDGTGDNGEIGGECGDNVTWTYDGDDKTLTITGTGDMDDYNDSSETPWSDIADEIEKVVIDDGVTSIGDNAFEGCDKLTDVTIPDSVETIGDNAFKGTSLTEVEIPGSVTEIGDGAFADCDNLDKVTFEGTTPPALGEGAIENSVDIVVPEGSEDAYKEADGFSDLTGNITAETERPGTSGTCGENVTWIYDEETKTLTITGTGDMDNWTDENPAPWAEIADKIEKVVIDKGVTSIGDNAFEGCTKLTGVEIPDTVKTIGDGAFKSTALTEVTIPKSVTTIGNGAFAGTNLEKVTFEGATPPTLGSGVFVGCSDLTNIRVPQASVDAYKEAESWTDVGGSVNITCTEHKWNGGVVTKPATTTSTGVKTYTCTACGETKTEDIPKVTTSNGGSGGSRPGGGSSRPSSSSSSGSSTASGDPTSSDSSTSSGSSTVTVNGTSQSWASTVSSINSTAGSGSTVTISGSTDIPADVIAAAAKKNVKLEVKVNDTFTWVLDAANVGEGAKSISVSDAVITATNKLIKNTEVSKDLRVTEPKLGTGASLRYNADKVSSGKFVNLFRVNGSALEFVAVAKIDAAGNALLPISAAGSYKIVISDETKLVGDLDNNMVLNALDAALMLKQIVNGDVYADDAKFDFSSDDNNNALDPAALLRWLVNK